MTVDSSIKWTTDARILKFDQDTVDEITKALGHEPSGDELTWLQQHEGLVPDDLVTAHGNLLTTVGLNRITNLIIGGGSAALTNAQAIVGVGSSTTAAAVGDTVLGGNGSSTTAWYQSADASYPTQSNGTITIYSTFATGNANFAWNEFCVAIATGTITAGGTLASVGTSPVMLNHKVTSLGTKASGSWQAQLQITLS